MTIIAMTVPGCIIALGLIGVVVPLVIAGATSGGPGRDPEYDVPDGADHRRVAYLMTRLAARRCLEARRALGEVLRLRDRANDLLDPDGTRFDERVARTPEQEAAHAGDREWDAWIDAANRIVVASEREAIAAIRAWHPGDRATEDVEQDDEG